jgi:hypothetical protein
MAAAVSEENVRKSEPVRIMSMLYGGKTGSSTRESGM